MQLYTIWLTNFVQLTDIDLKYDIKNKLKKSNNQTAGNNTPNAYDESYRKSKHDKNANFNAN